MNAVVPFGGFYNSIWSQEIEKVEYSEVQNLAENYDVDDSDIEDILQRHAGYRDMHITIARHYVEYFEDYINEKYGLDISLTFDELKSPKEYNFTTDRIFVTLSYEDTKRLLKAVGWQATAAAAKEMFTNRSGFISFYSPDITTWGRVIAWDHNQVLAIFNAAVADDQDYDLNIFYRMDDGGRFWNAYGDNVAWAYVEHALKYFHEDVEDPGPNIPVEVSDPVAYVSAFDELNHLKTH